MWTKPVVSLNDGGDFDSPVDHFPAVWLSNDEDKAGKAPGKIFELAVDWFAFGALLGKPCIEKAWIPVDFESHDAMNKVV